MNEQTAREILAKNLTHKALPTYADHVLQGGQGHLINAALSAMKEYATLCAPQWQPIETAPKDGTEIIAIDGERTRRVVRWDESSFIKGWYIALDVTPWSGGRFMSDAKAWQPLPEPPAQP